MTGPPPAPSGTRALRELAGVFLKLGAIGFGGPVAHIALMEAELVRRRGWLTREEFLDLLAATHVIPGPNSTEMAIHVGRVRAGAPGLVVAGVCFMLPAVLAVTAMAWAYTQWGEIPRVAWVLRFVQPVLLAVIAQALWALGRSGIRSWWLAALALATLAAHRLGVPELAALAIAGAVAVVRPRVRGAGRNGGSVSAVAAMPWPVVKPATTAALVPVAATVPMAVGLWPMFVVFLKIGSVLFGSGYVLLAFLRGDLVTRLGWLTDRQLLDAIAVGQITPGPLFTTATFIGYLLAGLPGATVATIGIFLPAFVFVAASGPLIPSLRRSPLAGAVLDALVAASLALMASVAFDLARAAVVDGFRAALAVAAFVLLARFKVNGAWLMIGAAALGLILGPGR